MGKGTDSQFKLAPSLTIDTSDDRVQKQGLRIAVISESGGGKSHTIALIAEQAKQQGLQVVFFDTHGEYWTFSEVFEDVLVVGGDNADLPLAEEAVDVYAEAYRQGSSLDFSFKEIFTDDELYGSTLEKILRALWKVQVNDPRPCLWVLEEAQLLCPQDKSIETVRRVGLVKSLATGGRKFGLSLIVSTQRPAEIHKTPLSQCWIRFFGKVTEELDMKAISPYLKPLSGESLRHLETGQFFVFGWMKTPTLQEISPKRLTRSGGDTMLLTPIARKEGKVNSSIKDLREQISKLLDKKEEEKTELASLRAKLAASEREKEDLRQKANVGQVIRDSLLHTASGSSTAAPVQELPPQTIAKLEQIGNLEAALATTNDRLAEAKAELQELQPYIDFKLSLDKILTKGQPVPVVDPEKPEWLVLWASKLHGAPKKLLQFLLDHPGTYKPAQLATLTGYAAKSGAFDSAIATLRRNKLVRDTAEGVRLA